MPPSALIAAQQAESDVTQTGWDVFIDIASQVTVLVALIGFVAWLLRPRLKELFRDTAETRKQVSDTNDGKHLRDTMNRIESKVDVLTNDIQANTNRLEDHIRHGPHKGTGR